LPNPESTVDEPEMIEEEGVKRGGRVKSDEGEKKGNTM
jgi:hypothetical protein